jgi:MinD-like ATPase involved in chromosome partitioning or flagellar assembly
MLFACWSAKGGSGTTVVAAALALLLADSSPNGVLLIDAAGDVPSVLGLPEPDGPGLADWLAAADVSPDALGRLVVDVAPGVQLLPWRGGFGAPTGEPDRLLTAVAGDRRTIVVDCGSTGGPLGLAVAASASVSLLVMRPCFLALRRALAAPIRPSGIVLVNEPGRSLGRDDIEDVLGVPVRAEVPWTEGVARSVDAGLLAGRLPRVLSKALKDAA